MPPSASQSVYDVKAYIAVMEQAAIEELTESLPVDRDRVSVMTTLPETSVDAMLKSLQSQPGSSFHSRPSIRTFSGQAAKIQVGLELFP